MPRGTQLQTLVSMLQAELGDDPSQGTNGPDYARLVQLLSNKQIELASAYDWPFLRDRQDVATASATRFYLLPGLNYDRPHKCENQWNQIWTDLTYGINEDDYNLLNSLIGQTSDPVLKWLIVDQGPVQAPTLAPQVVFNNGTLTGTFNYGYTVVTEYGESPISPLVTVTIGSKQANVSLFSQFVTVMAQGVAVSVPALSINVYRTKNGGTALFLVGACSPTGMVVEEIPDVNLTVPFAPVCSPAQVFEVWPIPQTQQVIRFTGQRLLDQLVNPTDITDLDDVLLIKGVAAQELARRQSPDAGLIAQQFTQRFQLLRSSGPTAPSVWVNGEASEQRQRSYKRVLLG